MTAMMQRTFGEVVGMEPMVSVTSLPTDLHECAGCGEQVEMKDLLECEDGELYCKCTTPGVCPSCDGNYTQEHLEDHNDYCESCESENMFVCEGCNDSFDNDRANISGNNDYYCNTCYSDRFDRCSNCSEELDRENDEVFSDDCGDAYCEGCQPRGDRDEIEVNWSWKGCASYDKMGSSRKFGIELETNEYGDYYDWASRSGWGVKEDGSISGMEFVSPPLHGNDGYDSVMEVCDSMDNRDYSVRDDCGFHLHLDMSDTSAEQRKSIALAYHYTYGFWHDMIDERRCDTSYSHKNEESRHSYPRGGKFYDRDDILAGDRKYNCGSRYVWANWHAYNAHGTLEIRAHHATLDGREVINWARAHAMFVDYVKDMSVAQVTRIFGRKTVRDVYTEMRFVWDSPDLSDYYEKRSRVLQAEKAECAA